MKAFQMIGISRWYVVCMLCMYACKGVPETYTNSLGIKFVRMAPGSFAMGTDTLGDFDEQPQHSVQITEPFLMAVTEVTNSQYERYDPQHRALRGAYTNSVNDDEPVVMVSWEEAVAFCRWLSDKEGMSYRLPTEAEWEYACRAGTTTLFSTGDSLPATHQKLQEEHWNFPKTDLRVAATPPNPWGLYDMHGNVEEWCMDWYGPYDAEQQGDPLGADTGVFRVSRGGSYGTDMRYLRSANRSGALPYQQHPLIGIRLVIGTQPDGDHTAAASPGRWEENVSRESIQWTSVEPDPFFMDPIPFVKIPDSDRDAMYKTHNHCPALTICTNGDLLSAWYSTTRERGRELSIVASRLRSGTSEWEMADVFWNAPDRNDHATDLLRDPQTDRLYFFNGMSADATWGKLTMIMRTSDDNGASWSIPEIIAPRFGLRNMPIAGSIITSDGRILLPCDAVTGGEGGTVLWEGTKNGSEWRLLSDSTWTPQYDDGSTGHWIAGIHAGVVELSDGRLVAFGRGNNIEGRMPMSISEDGGSTWTYRASPFPPISGGQRLALVRLREGPILFVSFTSGHDVEGLSVMQNGKRIYQRGMFAALSYDEGSTWPVRKLLSNSDKPVTYDGGAWTDEFVMDRTHAEPKGYLVAKQAPDGTIHLLSSGLHYRFNLAWLEAK